MSGTPKGGFKRGDHVFNHGLTKLDLEPPTHSLLGAAFQKFQKGLKSIEVSGGLSLVTNKASQAADVNASLFGERLTDLRNAWAQLNRVLGSSHPNTQHRAAAVQWTAEALKALRQACFDNDAAMARLREVNTSEARRIQDQINRTARQLDDVFDDLVKAVEKFMPQSGAIGQSMAGFRGKPRTGTGKNR